METVNLPHPFIVQYPLFKAYDIRGNHELFTDDFLAVLAYVFAEHYQQAGASTVVVGFDARQFSPIIADKLTHALITVGIKVLSLGLVTTPMMAFCAEQQEGHGIMVTASHSAKHYAGIKWLTHHQSPNSNDIEHFYRRMAHVHITGDMAHGRMSLNNGTDKKNPSAQSLDIFTDYQKAIKQVCQTLIDIDTKTMSQKQNQGLANGSLNHHTKPLKTKPLKTKPLLVIDCLNGATSAYAQRLFDEIIQMTGFAQSVIVLNDNADGNFPKGNPDPTEANRLTELANTVVKHHAKLGLAFDGDGDRLCVIDEQGRLFSQDNLLYLLGHIAISDTRLLNQSQQYHSQQYHSQQEQNKPAVLFDVKCSHVLPKLIQRDGGTPILSKTGSSHLRHALKNEHRHALFAGELSGHFIFNDGHFILHDDAMYAGVRLLIWLSKHAKSLANIRDSLPSVVSTGDVYLPLPTTNRPIIDALFGWYQHGKSFLTNTSAKLIQLDTTDGLRLEYEHGVGVVRTSNTSPSLTCRIAGDDLYHFNAIKAHLVTLCKQVDTNLATQIANINIHHSCQ